MGVSTRELLAQQKEVIEKFASKNIELENDTKILLKIAEDLSAENKALEQANAAASEKITELTAENKQLAADAGTKVQNAIEAASNPATTGGIGDTTKDALIAAVTQIDSEAGADVVDAINAAEDKGEVVDGEKTASICIAALRKISELVGARDAGHVVYANSKSASLNKTASGADGQTLAQARLEKCLNSVTRRS